jgi:hypothetical protein
MLLFVVVMAGVAWSGRARAQGIERESLANPTQVPSMDSQPYNLKLGQMELRMDASVNSSFNDNINIAKFGRQADFYTTPMLGFNLLWQPTEANTFHFNLGIGYQAYLEHSQYNGLVVAPNDASQLEYNIFVGDFKINAHDTFSYQQDPLAVGQLSNTAQFSRFINTAGVGVDWDLNQIIVSLDYDHTNIWVFQTDYEYLDNVSDTVSPQVSIKVSPTITAGVSTSFTDTRYRGDIQNDSVGGTVGPFVTAQLTDNLSVHAAAGGTFTNYDSGGLNGDSSTKNYTYYANAGISHRINDDITETLTFGRETIPGLTSNYSDRVYANYGNSWLITPTLTLQTGLWWENLQDSNAYFRETSNRYGINLGFSHSITDKLSLSLGYQYVLKVANPSNEGYYQDLVTLGLAYQF